MNELRCYVILLYMYCRGMALTFSLGDWQIWRLTKKLALNETIVVLQGSAKASPLGYRRENILTIKICILCMHHISHFSPMQHGWMLYTSMLSSVLYVFPQLLAIRQVSDRVELPCCGLIEDDNGHCEDGRRPQSDTLKAFSLLSIYGSPK